MATLPQTIKIQPSARILKVLGDIEFEPWQCLAELIDNSFDDFIQARRDGAKVSERPQVNITVPLQGQDLVDSEVAAEDNGSGMDLPTLNSAVKAGWSSNDLFGSLGLFGMGFNVATARLGAVTRILSTREGDSEWVGVEIDVDHVGEDFEVPVIVEEKRDRSEHGTRVVIRRLNPDRAVWLQRNAAHLRSTLGAVYSYLLDHEGFRLSVNDVDVVPRRPCAWDQERSVTYGSGIKAEQIPAIIPFDHPLEPAETCLDCRNWQALGLGQCAQCGGSNLVERARRLHGWLGIQRYLHPTEFGIDFLRNGRKILLYDKRIFEWRNLNDPLSPIEVEYPTELRQGGRIIGEVHVDHVPVNYLKNAFEWNDRSWIGVVHFLRGEGPLLPQKARQLGFGDNNSPIAKLHRGYRRGDPGTRYLVPGNGTVAIHDESRKWGRKFLDGDPEYQTDQIWWDAALAHDRKKEEKKGPEAQQPETESIPEGSVLEALGVASDDGASADGEVAASPRKAETESERLERYRRVGRLDPSLSGEFGLVEVGRVVKLKTYDVDGGDVQDASGQRTPVLMTPETADEYAAFVNTGHPIFTEFATDSSDMVMLELANNFRVRGGSEMPISEIVALLKLRHLRDERLDGAALAGEAAAVLRTVRERMAQAVRENPDRGWQHLTADERNATENAMISEGAQGTLAEARETGDFLLFAPPMFIPRLIEEWPEAFMDGVVFSGPYAQVSSTTGRRISVGKVSGYCYDAARLAVAQHSLSRDELIRARLSLELLQAELV